MSQPPSMSSTYHAQGGYDTPIPMMGEYRPPTGGGVEKSASGSGKGKGASATAAPPGGPLPLGPSGAARAVAGGKQPATSDTAYVDVESVDEDDSFIKSDKVLGSYRNMDSNQRLQTPEEKTFRRIRTASGDDGDLLILGPGEMLAGVLSDQHLGGSASSRTTIATGSVSASAGKEDQIIHSSTSVFGDSISDQHFIGGGGGEEESLVGQALDSPGRGKRRTLSKTNGGDEGKETSLLITSARVLPTQQHDPSDHNNNIMVSVSSNNVSTSSSRNNSTAPFSTLSVDLSAPSTDQTFHVGGRQGDSSRSSGGGGGPLDTPRRVIFGVKTSKSILKKTQASRNEGQAEEGVSSGTDVIAITRDSRRAVSGGDGHSSSRETLLFNANAPPAAYGSINTDYYHHHLTHDAKAATTSDVPFGLAESQPLVGSSPFSSKKKPQRRTIQFTQEVIDHVELVHNDAQVLMRSQYSPPAWAYLGAFFGYFSFASIWALIAHLAVPAFVPESSQAIFAKYIWMVMVPVWMVYFAVAIGVGIYKGKKEKKDRVSWRKPHFRGRLFLTWLSYGFSRTIFIGALLMTISSTTVAIFVSLPAVLVFAYCCLMERKLSILDFVGISLVVLANAVLIWAEMQQLPSRQDGPVLLGGQGVSSEGGGSFISPGGGGGGLSSTTSYSGFASSSLPPPPTSVHSPPAGSLGASAGVAMAIVASCVEAHYRIQLRRISAHFSYRVIVAGSTTTALLGITALCVMVQGFSATTGKESWSTADQSSKFFSFEDPSEFAELFIVMICLLFTVFSQIVVTHFFDIITAAAGMGLVAPIAVVLFDLLGLHTASRSVSYGGAALVVVGCGAITLGGYFHRKRLEFRSNIQLVSPKGSSVNTAGGVAS